jgi:protein-S-isoprenylcysteine O-methyltransferase Ste14
MRKKALKNNIKPYLFVLFQFSSLFGMMFTGPLFASGFVLFSVQIFGVFLGIWAVYVMKIGNFNIIPEPVLDCELRVNGPYRLIRHPMYTSILLFALPELVDYFNWWRLLLFILLITSLIVKLTYEETRLIKEYSGYADYKKKTKRLVPYIF